MGILLGFVPFVVFAILAHAGSSLLGLAAATVTSAGLRFHDHSRGRTPKLLEVGTLVLFAGLTAEVATGDVLSATAVWVAVDAGLLAIAFVSLALRRPFTLQYAREQVAPELRNTPAFLRVNIIITSVWAAAFLVMTAAEAALVLRPRLSGALVFAIVTAALAGAIWFTCWYPAHVRRSAARPSARRAAPAGVNDSILTVSLCIRKTYGNHTRFISHRSS